MDGGLRAFQSFMNGLTGEELVVWSLACLAFSPLLVLIHELGHASVPLVRTRGLVRVHVGREPGIVQRRIGRVLLTFDLRSGEGRAGFALPFAHMTRGEAIACILAGPAAHGLAGVALVVSGQPLLRVVGIFALAWATWNLIPRGTNDGALVMRLIRVREWRTRTPLDDITAAADAACADLKRNMVEPRRTILADGLTDPALLRAAYVGWCWGEASASHLSREAAFDALDAATRAGAVGPSLTIAAARRLAALPQHPGRHADAGVRSTLVPGCDEEATRGAFMYGMAVRDIERVRV
jgi:hypothetical protein